MGVVLRIARRYLFSGQNRSAVNIITGIAAGGVAVGVLALVVVLSAFNGLELLVSELYTSTDPDLRIMPARGKVIAADSIDTSSLSSMQGVAGIYAVLEEQVFLQTGNEQVVATLKGLPMGHPLLHTLDTSNLWPQTGHQWPHFPTAILGYGVADKLGLLQADAFAVIRVYAADRGGLASHTLQDKFNSMELPVGGIVAVNPDFDFKFLFAPLHSADSLLDREGAASYYDVELTESADANDVAKHMRSLLGSHFTVKTRIELNDVLYKTNATEKWITFFILCFIMVVATFNLAGSLSMLIIDKRSDLNLLRALGLRYSQIRLLLLVEGMLIVFVGSAIGTAVSVLVVLLQQHIGFIPLEGGLVPYYPVALHWGDVAVTLLAAAIVGFLASCIPVLAMIRPEAQATASSA